MFVIEKNVSMPEAQSGKTRKYPFLDMDVGDSFFAATETSEDQRKLGMRIKNAASYIEKKHAMKFSIRKVEGGVRIWRTL